MQSCVPSNSQQHNFVGSNVGFQYAFDNASQMLTQRTTDPANFRWTPGAPATVSYGTANNINQYPTVGGTGYTYSTDGNLTNDGTFKYEFNTERMMTRVRNAGTNAIISDYLYDPALRQRQKNVGGTKTNFYYAGWQRLADYDATAGTPGTLLNRYVYGAGMDEVLIQITSGGTKTYYHGNHQGSVVATTNSSGAVVNRYKYSPYGESPSMSGTTHGYTGQRFDSETGLYYYKMRYYSPKLARFLQSDPIGYSGGLNTYAYVDNYPVAATDPLGLAASGGSNGQVGSPGVDGYYETSFDRLKGKAVTWNVSASNDAPFSDFESWVSKRYGTIDSYYEDVTGDYGPQARFGVSVVRQYLESKGAIIKAIEFPLMRTYVSAAGITLYQTAWADLVYEYKGQIRYGEVKTYVSRMPSFSALTSAQEKVYPLVPQGNALTWDLSKGQVGMTAIKEVTAAPVDFFFIRSSPPKRIWVPIPQNPSIQLASDTGQTGSVSYNSFNSLLQYMGLISTTSSQFDGVGVV